eukprot:PhF_6_TR44443/c0_g1_i1/m.68410
MICSPYVISVAFVVAVLLGIDLHYAYLNATPETETLMLDLTGTNYYKQGQQQNASQVIRLQAKFKMVNPTAIWIDYPACRFIVHSLGLKNTFITANMISIVHPIFGLLAAYFILKTNRNQQTDAGSELFNALSTQEEVQKASAVSVTLPPNYMFNMRMAGVLFMIRNFGDALDGVQARAQRPPVKSDVQTSGHLLDVITDLTGTIAIGLALLLQMWRRQRLTLSSRIPGRCTSIFRSRPPRTAARIVLVLGLLYLLLAAAIWEYFMMKFSVFFDDNAGPIPALRDLEKSAPVQLAYFLWSMSCGDSMFSLLIMAMIIPSRDALWEVTQIFCFVGYFWIIFMACYSTVVWNYVILAHPATANAVIRW